MKLDDRSRIAVIGGGPAGSFFSYFLLEMAERVGIDIDVDIYETREFASSGPPGCNMCGGIVSESLVQILATEGINLPTDVVQRGIDSYYLHMDVGSVKIKTPLEEKRIAAVYRGKGPKGTTQTDWESFDGYLLKMAVGKGADLKRERVDDIQFPEGRPQVRTRAGTVQEYDLLAVASGVNTAVLKAFKDLDVGYIPPRATKTYICEYKLGREHVGIHLGSSMHNYLLNIPRLEFAAIIPKGEYATVCMLGEKIDKHLVTSFVNDPAVKQIFPPDWDFSDDACRCAPKMNIKRAKKPYDDRLVFIGDSGVSRLYKDGIGAAYKTSKAAAKAVLFQGVSSETLRKNYWPTCRYLDNDNNIGKFIFFIVGLFRRFKFVRKAILRMVRMEQSADNRAKHMSTVLWDMFTGSAPYREVLLRTLHPAFLVGISWNLVAANLPFRNSGLGNDKEEST